MKVKLILWITVVILGAIALLFLGSRSSLPDLGPVSSATPSPSGNEVSNLIKVDEPTPNQKIKSPVTVTGEARGTWYFEASFPVKIYDDNGLELAAVPAQAQADWMTEDFVPFKAILEFKRPETTNGVLVLKKDNPSGLPENEAEIRVPITFDLGGWPIPTQVSSECKVTGCSGQICSDQDVVTTCEYKEEYACYKTAKCERQLDGNCGWTPSDELVTCLGAAFQAESQ